MTDDLRRGDQVPNFEVTTLDGATVGYRTLWQHRNLVLIALPAADVEGSAEYVASVTGRTQAFAGHNATCIVTRDSIRGLVPPAVIVADRWGEIVYAAATAEVRDLPSADAILEWLEYVQHRCPECEGESR